MSKFEDLARDIGKLVDEKNAAYGNSFEQAGDFLRLLYPDGIPPEKYGDMLCVVRIFDKLKRIATKKGAFSESPYQDIVGYGLLGVERDLREVTGKALGAPESPEKPVHHQDLVEVELIDDKAPQAPESSNSQPVPSTVMVDVSNRVPVNCNLCGRFVAMVEPEAKGGMYVHDTCWAQKQNAG